MSSLLILIPAFNESESIEKVVELIASQYNYIVINDGSTDDTLYICEKNKYFVISFPINLGIESCIKAGMRYAYINGYDYVIQFDADGQHISDYIEPMFKKAQEGYDVVIGSRFINKKRGYSMRMIGSRMISLAIKLTTGKYINDPTSGMRLYSRKCMKVFNENINYGPEPDTISHLIRNGYSVTEYPVEMQERLAGKSYLSFINSIKYMTKMLVSILIIQNFRDRVG